MSGRHRPRNRCESCGVHESRCFCPILPRLELPTRVAILMHYRELAIRSGTAKLAASILSRCQIHPRGRLGEKVPELLEPGERGALLFPSESAEVLSRDWVEQDPRPLVLVVPDGSWRQTRKFLYRESALAPLPHVKLPEGSPGRYRLRKAPLSWQLSTFEAIARALGIIEGSEVQTAMEGVFEKMVEIKLTSAGRQALI